MTKNTLVTNVQSQAVSPQAYARIAGVLLLVSLIAGGIGEFYVPSQLIVSNDAAATARNFIASDALFRLGFASYLIEAVCDVALSLVFYVLLRPVRRNLALLAVFFGLVSTATFCAAQLFYFGASLIFGGADYLNTFSPAQLHSLAMLSLKFNAYGAGVFMVFYGIAVILRGYLIYHSGYLPRFLGVLFVLAGLGFVARNFLLVLAPAYASDLLLPPMAIATLSMTLWLLIKGVDMARWEAKAG